MRIPGPWALLLAVVACYAVPAAGQQCPEARAAGPSSASQVRVLEGTLIFHDSIRKWFELKLGQPRCGQPSIQLIPAHQDYIPLEVLRGCRVKSRGTIDFSPTGYFSLDTYQAVDGIEPIDICTRQSPFPDYSKAKPDKTVHEYRVDMHLDYEPGDHPIVFRISSEGKDLRPWQAYASYMLTGSFVLYGYCGTAFVVDKIFGTRQANPSHFTEAQSSDDAAAFDPENAAASGKKDLHLGYTCVRKP